MSDQHSNSTSAGPRWDPDLYARRVADYVRLNSGSDSRFGAVPRSGIAQFVAMSLDSRHTESAINEALERGLIEEAGDGCFSSTE